MTTYKIISRHASLSNSTLFDVSKNGQHVSTYLELKSAVIKVYNDLTGYTNCEPETVIKNSTRKSKLNNVNFIG